MGLATKLSPQQIELVEQTTKLLAQLIAEKPALVKLLPRSMHPVLADLNESATFVHGYLAAHGFGKPAGKSPA